jgi:hypothetical protein
VSFFLSTVGWIRCELLAVRMASNGNNLQVLLEMTGDAGRGAFKSWTHVMRSQLSLGWDRCYSKASKSLDRAF